MTTATESYIRPVDVGSHQPAVLLQGYRSTAMQNSYAKNAEYEQTANQSMLTRAD